MTSAIGSSTAVAPVQASTSAKPTQQIQATKKDSDGDQDGSMPIQTEAPKASSGPVGSVVNTKV